MDATPAPHPFEPNIQEYIDVLKRRRWIVIAFCFITTVSVLIASFIATPIYRATATIVVEGEETNVLNAIESANRGASFDIFENYLETQMEIILSRSVAGKVFDQFKLIESDLYKDSKEPFQSFTKDIVLQRLKGTRIIKISVDNPSPELAKDLANGLADAYAQDNLMRRSLTFIRNQRMANLNSEFLRLEDKFESLSALYGPNHPDMIALQQEVEKLATQILDAPRSTAEPTKKSKQLDFMKETLLKIQEASVISSSRMSNIYVADKATVPHQKIRPKRILNTLIGFVGSLVVGVFLAFAVNYLDDTIRTQDDLKRYMGHVPFLGFILNLKGRKNKTLVDQIVQTQSESAAAEAYRLFRTRILWSVSRDHKLKDIAVLSTGPSEGKTTVASNLAIAFSQIKMKVLLVDTDVRRGRLHESYRVDNTPGLGHYLMETCAFKDIVRKTEIPDLSIVTCGESVVDSSQLFMSQRMTEFVAEARKNFDIVVYDTPPVTMIADAGILMKELDAAVLVVRCGLTGIRQFMHGLTLVHEMGVKLIGVVLNGSDASHSPYYSKYYTKK